MRISLIVGILAIFLGILIANTSGKFFGPVFDGGESLKCFEGYARGYSIETYDSDVRTAIQSFLLIGFGLGIVTQNVFSRYALIKKK